MKHSINGKTLRTPTRRAAISTAAARCALASSACSASAAPSIVPDSTERARSEAIGPELGMGGQGAPRGDLTDAELDLLPDAAQGVSHRAWAGANHSRRRQPQRQPGTERGRQQVQGLRSLEDELTASPLGFPRLQASQEFGEPGTDDQRHDPGRPTDPVEK